MTKEMRLRRKVEDLQDSWNRLRGKLGKLREALELETRIEEKLRLQKQVDDAEQERAGIEQQLGELESQLKDLTAPANP